VEVGKAQKPIRCTATYSLSSGALEILWTALVTEMDIQQENNEVI
jgi:hypothetical protein